ncbi:MAG TPA: mechanosensitive ion channel family protein [Prolixibacteraceae bacterium]|nr:mechanosensitive ion channel family protein [Prolixibacteraceae bacterium]
MEIIDTAYQTISEKINNWAETFIAMLPNFVVAVLILVLFYFLSKLIVSILSKTVLHLTKNVAVKRLIKSVARILVMTTGLFVALGVMDLDKTVTSLLAGVGIMGLAIGFAFQDAIANFLSGIYITLKSTVNVDNIIKFGDYFGKVEEIGLRAIKMRTFQGQQVVIPNRLIFEDVYIHYTIYGERRIDLEVGVSYGDDLQKVEDIALEAIKSIDYLKKGKPVDLYYQGFGDSSINFTVRYWVEYGQHTDYLKAQHDGIKKIKAAFDSNDITIPFPIRTLDFGIKGGKTLDEVQMKVGRNGGKGKINQ